LDLHHMDLAPLSGARRGLYASSVKDFLITYIF